MDSLFSIMLLPLLLFNTSFDLYKRTQFILVVKIITTCCEYLVVACLTGLFLLEE